MTYAMNADTALEQMRKLRTTMRDLRGTLSGNDELDRPTRERIQYAQNVFTNVTIGLMSSIDDGGPLPAEWQSR